MQGDCDNTEGKLRRNGEEVQVQADIWLEFLLPTCGWWPQQPQAWTSTNWRYMDEWLVGVSGICFNFGILEVNVFLFYATLSTVRYIGRECINYWNLFGSWRGNLLTIYTLGNCRGGGWVLAKPHSLVDDCTKECEKISELEADLHYKICLSTVQPQI